MFFFLSSTRPSVLWTIASCFFMSPVTPVPASRPISFGLAPSSSSPSCRAFSLPPLAPFLPLPLPAALPSAASSTFSSSNLPVAISSAFLMAWLPTSLAISSMFMS